MGQKIDSMYDPSGFPLAAATFNLLMSNFQFMACKIPIPNCGPSFYSHFLVFLVVFLCLMAHKQKSLPSSGSKSIIIVRGHDHGTWGLNCREILL